MDTFNKHMVGVHGDNIVIMNPPRMPMSKADALIFAAWIVTLADYSEDEKDFRNALEAVRS
jgi:hypothetical protein